MPRAPVTADGSIPSVVIDNGSGFIKAGFGGEDEPRVVLPARGLGGLPQDTRPMKRGVVQDWEAMETYWDHAFGQLGVDTAQCNLMVTAPLFDTKDNKERLMQCLFETFAAPGVYTCAPAVFELYASNRENGVVLGCGAECTYALLMHEGLPDPRTLVRSDVAGDALTQHTASILQQLGGGAAAAALPFASVAKAKETLAFVAPQGPGAALPKEAAAREFELPDGKKLSVNPEARAAMAEPLFDASLVGQPTCGLAGLVAEAIRCRDKDGMLESTEHGKDGTANWYRHVVLAGGTSMLPGLQQRLVFELGRYAPDGCTPEVVAVPERAHAAWLGGSILASLSVMKQMWISKAEYDENGPLIVHRKTIS